MLVPGLEDLSREIDRLVNAEEGEIDQSIKDRFNPCIFLAEYLMRNNPMHGNPNDYQELFAKYSRLEKIRRFFNNKKQRIYKHFCVQPYQANFTKAKVKEYIASLDSFLQMQGKLVKHFNWKPHFEHLKPTDSLQFEDLYDVLWKWACSPEQTALNYNDFARENIDAKLKVQSAEEFKHMTD